MLISLERVSKVYPNGTRALRDVSLSIEAGEFIGLLGRNGAGKSTLIQCLIGALYPTSGNVSFNLAKGSDVAWVNQLFAIDWLLSVKDNARLGARLGGATFREAESVTTRALNTVDLADKTHDLPETLSGGCQKRLQVARALAQDPKVYLLDEPTTGLDAQAGEAFFAHLLALTGEGKSCLVATHELDSLENFATRIVMLRNGEIIADRSLADFSREYSPGKLSLKEAFKNAENTV